jgi:hypothetical protein
MILLLALLANNDGAGSERLLLEVMGMAGAAATIDLIQILQQCCAPGTVDVTS